MFAIRRGKRLAALMVAGMFVASPLTAVADEETPAPEPPAASAPASGNNGKDDVPDPGFETLDGGDVEQGNTDVIIHVEDQEQLKRIKREIKQLVDSLPDKVPLESADDEDKEALDKTPSDNKTYEPEYQEKADFKNAFDGAQLKVPARIIKDIEGIKGVKGVFPERDINKAELKTDAAPGLQNAVPLDMTGAASVDQKGAGQVIAVIDDALNTNHEAFAGQINTQKAVWTSAKIASIRGKLAHGRSGQWISAKIPFVYDYADNDSIVSTRMAGFDHGTHVAGIATANNGSIRGTAPDAQLIFMKVAKNSNGSIPTSGILKALEDCITLKPDSVNMSLGNDAGASKAEQTVFGEVYARLRSTGITLNVAASNAYSSAYKNKSGQNLPYISDPDSSTIGDPGSFTESFAVASVETAGQQAGSAARTPNRRVNMSPFSSWGVRPDGKLKPEISAPGGEIISSVNSGYNSYGKMSGTSMATPQLAGISAQMHEHLKGSQNFSGLSDNERAKRVTQLLMGTATPVKDVTDMNSYISPRKQGAGLANVPAAVQSNVYPTVKGAEDISRPKADLGDGTRGWTYTVTLHNVSNQAVNYSTESVALSEKVSGGFFQEHSKNWTGQGINVTHSKNNVTVPARGSVDVTVKVAIGQQFYDFARTLPNGTFIDGFTFFRGKNGAPDLSIPFCGFYGDWGTIPMFDATAYDNQQAHMYESFLANFGTGKPLSTSSARRTYAQYIMPMTGTLRTAEKMTYTYTNAQGQVVKSYEYEHSPKSLYNPMKKLVFNSEASIGQPVFSGTDNRYNRLPDGQYTLTITAKIAGSNKTQKLIYTFYYGRSSGSYVINSRIVRDAAGNAAPPDNRPVDPDPDPTQPAQPDPTPTPSNPANPSQPAPDNPSAPADPMPTPEDPAKPTDPAEPVTPDDPAQPSDPANPADPADPADPVPDPTAPANPSPKKKGTDTISVKRGTTLYIKNKLSSSEYAQEAYSLFRNGDVVYAGDWDGDGISTVAVKRGTKVSLIDDLKTGHVSLTLDIGAEGDQLVVGDWNGDGRDSFGIRKGTTFTFIDDLNKPKATRRLTVNGSDGLEVVAGDWDGDGIDTLAFRKGDKMTLLLKPGNTPTKVVSLPTGVTGQTTVLAGDWNGDGIDTFALRKGGWYHVSNSLTDPKIEQVAYIGNSSDEALVGNWDGK